MFDPPSTGRVQSGGKPGQLTRGDTVTAPVLLPYILDEVAGLLGHACGPDDDLFEKGATSMTAIRLATRVARACGRPVSATDVFTARTPASLAACVGARAGDDGFAPDEPREGDATLPESLRRFWTIAEQMPNQQEAIGPMLLRLTGAVDRAAMRAALDAVVARHEALRSLFYRDGERVAVRVLPATDVTGLLMVHDEPVDPAVALADVTAWLRSPFNLAGTIPIRARLVPLADGDHLLAVAVHHIVMDGWSSAQFWRDLVRAYSALRAGSPPFTGTVPGFLGVFQNERRLHADGHDEAVRYWSELVRDAPWLRFPGADGLPTFGPTTDVELPLTDAILARAGRAAARVGSTATAVLLACYVRRLRAYLGTDDIAVSIPIAGRSLPDSEEAIGCFAGGLAVRLPATCVEPVELVGAAADQLHRALRSPALTVDQIYPDVPPDFGRHPLAQVYFAPQEPMPSRVDFDGAAGISIPIVPDRWYAEIAMEIRPHPAVGGMLRYRTDVIPTDAAARFVDDWIADVESVAKRLLSGA